MFIEISKLKIKNMIYSLNIRVMMLAVLSLFSASIFAQGQINIDYKTKRYIGNKSAFERSKYLTFHSWFKEKDVDFEKFKKTYNIDPDYNGSRLFNNPGGKHKKGKFPEIKNKYNGIRPVTDFVSTGSPHFFYFDKEIDYSEVDVSPFSKEAARFAADYFSYEANDVPKFYEPFNEPMVHAADFIGDGKKSKDRAKKVETIIDQMIAYHVDVINAIKAKPELSNMLVGGFGSAFPEFEAGGFDLWNNRFKKFIDATGKDIDFYALHLYDGSGVNNKDGRRSGSNSEAILDMLEAYSYIVNGHVKPYAITEYGRLVPDQPDYKKNGNYVPLVNSQAVRSQLHLVMNFIERGENLILSTPFTVGKQKLTSTYSKSSLWVEQKDGSYDLSQRKYFFEIWKDVKGDRVRVQSTNIDVQSQAFVDGKQLYVVLNNLNDTTQSINLNLIDMKGLVNVEMKRLNIYEEKMLDFTTQKFKETPKKLDLQYGETIVLTYNFKSPVKFENEVHSKKHYAESYLQPIVADEANTFMINNVDIKNGEATLRLGVGREHGLFLTPEILVNGNKLEISGDVIRGYDQSTRKQFFGVMEIPVNPNYLKPGENEVQVSFPDNGGHISSVILQTQNLSNSISN